MSLSPFALYAIARAIQLPDVKAAAIDKRHRISSINSCKEFFELVLTIGIEEEKLDAAEELISDLDERITIIKHKLKFIKDESKPTVLCLGGINPVSTLLNPYLTEIIQIAGARVYDANAEPLVEEVPNPDILLLISNKMEQLFADLAELLSGAGWRETNAVKNNRVFLLNGQHNFRGFGLQLASDVEALAEIFYPQQLTFGKDGESWIQFET